MQTIMKPLKTVVVVMVVAVMVVAVVASQQPTMEVTLKQGAILGSREDATNGRTYYSFTNIPYAMPPVGPLRFKDPQPGPTWSGVRNGSLTIPKCPQGNFITPGLVSGQEDCLYLNVYTPRPYPSNLPVMVYIHGGGFVFGTAMEQGMTVATLLQKDVVVVALNYRLGALGFLSTGDSVIPGNLGLKDQSMALRWVQDNINDFGGNPKQVTIFGVSAGGMSAHYHVLSPSSTGLFQRAILQSGTALIPAIIAHPRKNAIKVSKALNCTGEQSQQLLSCFNEAAVEDLVNVPSTLGEWLSMPSMVGPCVDGTFLPDHPAVLVKKGQYNKVDIMSGSTKEDGNVFAAGIFSEMGTSALRELNENFTKVGPIMLGLLGDENPVYLARRLLFKDLYKTVFNITKEDEFSLIKATGDHYFLAPNIKTIEFHSKDSSTKTFMYQFDHEPEISFMTIYLNATQQRPMAGHGDDMMFLFHISPPLGPLRRIQDLHMQEIIVTLWTNFASTGNPTINGTLGFRWSPVAAGGPLQYLSLTTTPTMQAVDAQDVDFMSSLPTKINKMLYPERFLEDL